LSDELRITAVASTDPVAVQLVRDLLDDLDRRYGPEEDGGAAWLAESAPQHVSPPDGLFLVAWLGDVPVGCGAIKRFDVVSAELKRMYTAPAGRRRGVAKALLAALEDAARGVGYEKLRLETGTAQPEAIALYEKAGYVPIPLYGRYADDPQSRCYEKAL